MIDIPFRVLLADYFSHSILLVDVPTGAIQQEIPYPAALKPSAVLITADKQTAYIPCVKNGGKGSLFALNLNTFSLYELPVQLPHPAQFTLSPGGQRAYLADPGGSLYGLDLISMELTLWGQMPEDASCAGIAADASQIYTVWEHPAGGTLAVFNRQGILKAQQSLSGVPTAITLTPDGYLIIPYTASAGTGEGAAILRAVDSIQGNPELITVQCPDCVKGLRAYPSQAVMAPNGTSLYLVNEDSSSLSVVSMPAATVTGCIPIGHSLSQIAVSADGRFAVGASNWFADLCLIDLMNERLVSLTDTPRELSGFIAAV